MPTLRSWVGRRLNLWTLRTHRSRLGWREAPQYTRHWRKCQKERPRTGYASADIARQFWRDGSVAIKTYSDNTFMVGGPVDDFLRAAFRCDYTIFYAKSYTSEWAPEPSGSQLWHADGGPGTCIILMRYNSDVGMDDGPLQVVRWGKSLDVFSREPKGLSRDELCAWYATQVKPWDRTRYTGSRYTMVAFMNNCIHRGGYPAEGHTRHATVYHVYPSLKGSKVVPDKTASYPKDPDI